MATTSVRGIAKKPPSNEAATRQAYAAAVLAGIYAASGAAILNLENHEYADALRNARKVAFDQADEMLKGASS